ncbi:sperm acrosome membrane-associated protein 6 [Tiliqua scincoides]|uniref:sperm acrosome membrane-associated protein 6 n=1 Tax=Tiliqua scincoides TaxID=71010 RepID=UPI003462953E
MLSVYALILWLALSSQVTACLLCFSTKAQRLRVCQYFLGHQSPQHGACLEALRTAFLPYTKIQVAMFQLEKLKDTFSKVIFYLEEKGMANVPYHQAIPEAAGEVQKEVVKLKAGIQEVARHYKCDSCRIMDCQLPVDCPLTAVHKAAGDTTFLKCDVKFALPAETTVKWKFAKDLNTQHLTLFKDLYFGYSTSLLIKPTLGSHQGTYTCQIAEENDILVRKYFYLNVTTKYVGREKELQKMFREILNPPPGVRPEEVEHNSFPSLQEVVSQPDYLHKKNVILLIIGLALSSMLLTLIAL